MPKPLPGQKEKSRPLSELPLIEQIDMVIAKNGAVSQDVKDLLMFGVVKTLVIAVGEIQDALNALAASVKTAEEGVKTLNEGMDKRVTVLERRNLVTWAIAHPKTALVILALLAFLLLSHYGSVILDLLGIKLP